MLVPKVSKNRRAFFLSTCLFNNLLQTLVDWWFQTSSYRNLVLWESILSSATLHCCLVVHLRLLLHERPNFQTILAVLLFPKNDKSQNHFMGFCLRFYQRQYSGFHYFHGLNYCDNYLKFKDPFLFLYLKMWNLNGMVKFNYIWFRMWIRNLLQLNEYAAVPYFLKSS